MASEEGMYGDRAELYDRIYTWKDYAAEAEAFHAILEAEGVADGGLLVDAACGTGSHLVQFQRWYRVAGFDISESLAAVARTKLPDVRIDVADMTDFELPEPADAITCLFSAIGYVHGAENLASVARSMFRNVRPGGVALVEAWMTPEQLRPGHLSMQTSIEDDMKIARGAIHTIQDGRSIFDFHWLVVRPSGIEHFTEHHEMDVLTADELCAPFREAGFDLRWDAKGISGRGIVIARRPSIT